VFPEQGQVVVKEILVLVLQETYIVNKSIVVTVLGYPTAVLTSVTDQLVR
jgi:hypothetical protein